MPTISPLRGVRYDPSRIGDLAEVVAPPYDVVSTKEEAALRARSPYNVVHLDLPKAPPGQDKYDVAGKLFRQWLDEGVLVRESEPRLYVYEQRFMFDDKLHRIRGVMAAVGLEPLGAGVLPHEETLVGPSEDRLSLMRTTEANLSPVYGIYSDPGRLQADAVDTVATAEPNAQVEDDAGVIHTLWSTADPDLVSALQAAISPHTIFIADGHHRYNTALAYQRERRQADAGGGEKPYDRILMLVVNIDDGQLVTLPVHRLVRNLPGLTVNDVARRLRAHFDVEELPPGEPDDLARKVDARYGGQATFGVYAGAGAPRLLASLKAGTDPAELIAGSHSDDWKRLEIAVLHRLVLEKALAVERAHVKTQRDVAFTKCAAEAGRSVDSGEFELAFLVAPTPALAVQKIARHGERMPQKSTYFYPKPLTGLVINPLS